MKNNGLHNNLYANTMPNKDAQKSRIPGDSRFEYPGTWLHASTLKPAAATQCPNQMLARACGMAISSGHRPMN